jgi:hypothetical protein
MSRKGKIYLLPRHHAETERDDLQPAQEAFFKVPAYKRHGANTQK